MPRIQFFSDIHLEFGDLPLPATDADIIVAAGDIGVELDGLAWLNAQPRPVVYVAGNHEYYGGDWRQVHDNLTRAAAGSNVHFLDRGSVVLAGVRFLGATLWTDLDNANPRAVANARAAINDYHQIRHDGARFDPAHTLRMNWESRQWLANSLDEPHNGPTVVVTHHAPSHQSWHESPLSPYLPAYCNDLEDLMNSRDIDLWFHGHIHETSDYTIGKTRVLCNPRGYNGFQTVAGFDPARAVDL
jgi:Icc-related predicted phosphoesterase